MFFDIFIEIETGQIIDQPDLKKDIVVCLVIIIDFEIIIPILIKMVVVFFGSEYCNLAISHRYCFYC